MSFRSTMPGALVCALAACSVVAPPGPCLVYEFVCLDPADCDGDANFRVTFDFRFADPGDAAGLAITADNPLFRGWTARSDVGVGFDRSGTTFLGNDNQDVQFTFNEDGSKISGLMDLLPGGGISPDTSVTIAGGVADSVQFQEGVDFTYFVSLRSAFLNPNSPAIDSTDIHGEFRAAPDKHCRCRYR
jgi:hypothetical protein